MKRMLLAVIVIAATAVVADDLVEAARAAKAKRKKSTTKVITNADVKKAKAKLGETTLTPLAEEDAPKESSSEKHEREKHERAVLDVKLAAARRTVTEYENELILIEQRYYEENDLDRRDRELVRRFNDVTAKLEAARKELEALMPPAPPPIRDLGRPAEDPAKTATGQ